MALPGIRCSHIIRQAFSLLRFPNAQTLAPGLKVSFIMTMTETLCMRICQRPCSWVLHATLTSLPPLISAAPPQPGQWCSPLIGLFSFFPWSCIKDDWDLWTWQSPEFFPYTSVFYPWLFHVLKMTGSWHLDIHFWSFCQSPGSRLLVDIELKEGTR